jgi:hypothetical protein
MRVDAAPPQPAPQLTTPTCTNLPVSSRMTSGPPESPWRVSLVVPFWKAQISVVAIPEPWPPAKAALQLLFSIQSISTSRSLIGASLCVSRQARCLLSQ